MNPINYLRFFTSHNPEKIYYQLQTRGVVLNQKQIEKILHAIEKTKITPENVKRKEIVASILRKVETRLQYLENTSKADHHPQSSYDKIQEVRKKWQIQEPSFDKTLLQQKIKRALERAKMIGKGSAHADAKILEPLYWLETIAFQLNDREVKLYGPTLYPHFVAWKNSEETRDFQTVMQEKIDAMPHSAKEALERSVLKLLNDDELEQHKAIFKDGKVQAGDQILNGTYIFVVDPKKKNLYVGKKEHGRFQHSSFFQGGAVGSAGILEVQHGKIISIKNYSGHYAPPPEMLDPSIRIIKDAGQKDIKVTKLGGKKLTFVNKIIQVLARVGLLKT